MSKISMIDIKAPRSGVILTACDFMELAYQMALQAACLNEVPVGAVLTEVVNGKEQIIAIAHNQTLMQTQIAAHAEMLALEQACQNLKNYRLNNCKIYITLEPCLMCAGAIINARVSTVYYLLADAKTGVADSVMHAFDLPFNHHTKSYIYHQLFNHVSNQILNPNLNSKPNQICDDTSYEYMMAKNLEQAYMELLQTFFRQKRLAKK